MKTLFRYLSFKGTKFKDRIINTSKLINVNVSCSHSFHERVYHFTDTAQIHTLAVWHIFKTSYLLNWLRRTLEYITITNLFAARSMYRSCWKALINTLEDSDLIFVHQMYIEPTNIYKPASPRCFAVPSYWIVSDGWNIWLLWQTHIHNFNP